MKKLLACSLVAMGVGAFTPAMAQGIHLGTDGVGIGTGGRNYDRGYDRDRGDNYRDHRSYEGRSVFHGNRSRRQDDDE